MQTVYFKGTPCHTYGTIPAVGEKAPCYNLVDINLKEIQCLDFRNKRVVLNVFPSLDTPVCAASVRRFNEEAAKMDNTVVICVSMEVSSVPERIISPSPLASSDFCNSRMIFDSDSP